MDEQQVITAATTPTDDTNASAPEIEPSGDGLQETAFCLPVKFNKQDYQLTLEEATTYAQKGMKFDRVEPILDKLKTLAEQHGLGVRELVDVLCDGEDASVTPEQRMADEFLTLRAECPAVTAFEDLPDSVVRVALDDRIPLLDAYLRYEYRERQKIIAAETAARRAGEASAGSQREAPKTVDSVTQAMISGIWR